MNTHAPLSMLDVIRIGASKRVIPKPCPFCGTDAPLATKVGPRFVIACLSEDCDAIAQASGSTMDQAWARWNRRF